MAEYIQVVTTTTRKAEAQAIARAMVERRLAACAQVLGPVTSTYWWEGKLETNHEWQCWIKTRRDLYEQIEQAIRQLHSYAVPEILAIPVVAGSESFWPGSTTSCSGRGY